MDKKLFEELYEKHYRALFLYVYSLCRKKEVAEDVVQEAFFRALMSFPDDHPEFRSWLFTVARNLTFKTMKHRRWEESIETLSEEPPDPGKDFGDRIALSEEQRVLYEALASLPPREREVLMLYYFSGLSHGEVARTLAIKPETARVTACRGREKLRNILEELGYDFS